MRVAVTGGTGFVGGHLVEALASAGHDVVVIARGVDVRPLADDVRRLAGVTMVRASITDEHALTEAFSGCDAVAHCAGINREIGDQSFQSIHVDGTRAVVRAAEAAGVSRLAFVSFLRARPDCAMAYHESKWAAEEIVRSSRCQWTVVKPGMLFGRGDHMLDHLSHALFTFPVYVGVGDCRVRPLAVEDLVAVLVASVTSDRLAGATVALVGPTELAFDDAARLVARVTGQRRLFVRGPLPFHRALAAASEALMVVPLIARAQVQILEEGVVEPLLAPDAVPDDLKPTTPFDESTIRHGLPVPGGFSVVDLRLWSHYGSDGSGAVLIFDGDCGFCTTVAQWAARGFHHGERSEPWQFLDDDFLARHGLTRAEVGSVAWWVDDRGVRDGGHRAVGRALVARGGWWSLLGLCALTPPTSWAAAAGYRLVVRWRYRLPGGTPACRVAR